MSNSYSDPQSVANHPISRSVAELLKARLSRRQVLKGTTLLPLLGLPLEYDEPDSAPDFDDDEWDDDEFGPIDVLAELIRAVAIEPQPP